MCHDKNPSFPPSNIDIIRMVWLTHSYNVRLPHETYWLPGLSSLSGHTLSSFYLNIVTYLTYCQVKEKIFNKKIWLICHCKLKKGTGAIHLLNLSAKKKQGKSKHVSLSILEYFLELLWISMNLCTYKRVQEKLVWFQI